MPLADLGEGQTMYSVRPCAADWLEVLEWGLTHPETAPLFGIDRRKIMKTQSYTGSPEYRRMKPVRWTKLERFNGIISASSWKQIGICFASAAL